MKDALSPEQETQARQLADHLAAASREGFPRIARALVAAGPSPFGPTEFEVRDLVPGIGARAFEQAPAQKNGYDGSGMTCPGCGQAAAFHENRERTLVGLCGRVRYRRAYHYCRRCGGGLCPFGAAAGIGPHQLTLAAEQRTALAGVLEGAEKAPGYFDLYTSTAKPMNVYSKFFAGKLGFRDEAAARESVGQIDHLYRQFGLAGDRAGQHHALLMALTMFDRARWTGKEREADVFRRWLRERLDEPAAAGAGETPSLVKPSG